MTRQHFELEPIAPGAARDLYLKHKEANYAQQTVQSHTYCLKSFVRWCEETGLENLNELSGRDLQEYRLWRQDDGDLKQISLNQQMSTIRVFLQWCESIEAVQPDLYEKVMVPRVKPEDERREETLSAETARTILDYLSRFHYASVEHALFGLLWETGMRLGGAYSLDVDDFHPGTETIELVHRPDEGTRLKNGGAGERPIATTTDLAKMLHDYVENNRIEGTDEYGRTPMFTTSVGRMHRGTMRNVVYRATAPCFRGEPCPECTGTEDRKCPEAVSPHALRRGSITHFLTNDIPVEIVGDRMNVSRKVLEKHYDRRSEAVKLEQRRGYLDNL